MKDTKPWNHLTSAPQFCGNVYFCRPHSNGRQANMSAQFQQPVVLREWLNRSKHNRRHSTVCSVLRSRVGLLLSEEWWQTKLKSDKQGQKLKDMSHDIHLMFPRFLLNDFSFDPVRTLLSIRYTPYIISLIITIGDWRVWNIGRVTTGASKNKGIQITYHYVTGNPLIDGLLLQASKRVGLWSWVQWTCNWQE